MDIDLWCSQKTDCNVRCEEKTSCMTQRFSKSSGTNQNDGLMPPLNYMGRSYMYRRTALLERWNVKPRSRAYPNVSMMKHIWFMLVIRFADEFCIDIDLRRRLNEGCGTESLKTQCSRQNLNSFQVFFDSRLMRPYSPSRELSSEPGLWFECTGLLEISKHTRYCPLIAHSSEFAPRKIRPPVQN
jgi:hypothetical protein